MGGLAKPTLQKKEADFRKEAQALGTLSQEEVETAIDKMNRLAKSAPASSKQTGLESFFIIAGKRPSPTSTATSNRLQDGSRIFGCLPADYHPQILSASLQVHERVSAWSNRTGGRICGEEVQVPQIYHQCGPDRSEQAAGVDWRSCSGTREGRREEGKGKVGLGLGSC